MVGNRIQGVNTVGGGDSYYYSKFNNYDYSSSDFYQDIEAPAQFIENKAMDFEGSYKYNQALLDDPLAYSGPGLPDAGSLNQLTDYFGNGGTVEDTSISAEAAALNKANAIKEKEMQLRSTGTILKGVMGVGNALLKYDQVKSQNDYNISQARLQTMNVVANSRYAQLREQTKGKAAGNQALLSAVARGQSAQGDLARTAVSNEEVYAAQNMMNIEINAMREVFGIESKIRQLELNTNLAEINRNKEIADSVISSSIAFL